MIVLDTNVVSELMRRTPQSEVVSWLDDQLASDLFVTAVTEAEILTGIALLPAGARRGDLEVAATHAFGALFAGRVLPFDSEAARAYAVIAVGRRAAGRPIHQADCEIAAIARSRGAAVATRDVDDFEGCGIDVVNPWAMR